MATTPAHGADAAHETSGIFPPFDFSSFPSQIFWLALTFGVLYIFMSKLVLPRIGGAIDRRADSITQDLEEASRMSDRAAAAQQSLETELAAARAKARATAAQAKADIEAEVAAETAKTEAEVDARITEASARIADAQTAAMKNVQEVASTAASSIVNKLIGVDISTDDASKAVSGVLKGN
ncbi:ATPase [Hirschia litorea]|uniref:ATP synthase subunit b n=1 Tax=Hirschia litorea TaxID=1199156 RepID=A0ABW2IJM1_9PROT